MMRNGAYRVSMSKPQISYRHVDVFSQAPLSGNGLTVFVDQDLSTEAMQKITQEMRQFESIFLFSTNDPKRFDARIFTIEEELDFAGHPILGAACVLHEMYSENEPRSEWIFKLRNKEVGIQTLKKGTKYFATMEQGSPDFFPPLGSGDAVKFLEVLNLSEDDVYNGLPLQVVSTGLPYLIVPVKSGLEKIRFLTHEFEKMLADINAKFAYILDVSKLEGRTWDNAGSIEDIATGSAAGPVGAYLVKHGIKQTDSEIVIRQGRFLGRPSQIFIKLAGTPENITSVQVSGEVCMVARGIFDPFEI